MTSLDRPPIRQEPLAVLLVHRDHARQLPGVADGWLRTLAGHDLDFVLIDDGSSDGSADAAAKLAAKHDAVRVLRSDVVAGFGSALARGLAETTAPLVLIVSPAQPILPAVWPAMLDQIDAVDLVNAQRVTPPGPPLVRRLRWLYRIALRVLCNVPVPADVPWFGGSAWWRERVIWGLFALRLLDPESHCKLVRRSALARFPLQSSGEFALIELLAKANFLDALMAEVPATPGGVSAPFAGEPRWGPQVRALFGNPKFHHPASSP